MLGWSFTIIRGGTLSGVAVGEVENLGGETVLATGGLPGLDTLPILERASGVEQLLGGGYPSLYRLPAGSLQDFLSMLDVRAKLRSKEGLLPSAEMAEEAIPDDELVYVKVWDQS